MRTDKWLYFRNVADVDDDDGANVPSYDVATSLMIPANRVINMFPVNDTLLRISMKAVKHADTAGDRYKRSSSPDKNAVDIHITANKHKEVMQSIISAINSPSRDSFIVIADDVVTDVDENTITAEYVDSRISGCGTVGVKMTPQGYGMHEYYEVVSPMAASHIDDVTASLSVKLPAQCIILEAAMTGLTLATSNHGSLALEYHNAAIADDAASGGTELVGAGAKAGGSGEVAKPVYTITFAGALVASNTFDMNVNGVALATQTFATNSNTTVAAIATALAALSTIESAAVTDAGGGTDDDRVITVTGAVKGVEVNMDGLTVAAGGSQTTAALAQTTNSWSGLSSMPPADLDISSDAIQYDTVHSGSAAKVDRGTAETYFHVCAKEDMSSMTGTLIRVGVYIRWFGGPAIALSQS